MLNRLFASCKNSHFKNEAKCKTFLVKMSFIYVITKSYSHQWFCALHLFGAEARGNSEMVHRYDIA